MGTLLSFASLYNTDTPSMFQTSKFVLRFPLHASANKRNRIELAQNLEVEVSQGPLRRMSTGASGYESLLSRP